MYTWVRPGRCPERKELSLSRSIIFETSALARRVIFQASIQISIWACPTELIARFFTRDDSLQLQVSGLLSCSWCEAFCSRVSGLSFLVRNDILPYDDFMRNNIFVQVSFLIMNDIFVGLSFLIRYRSSSFDSSECLHQLIVLCAHYFWTRNENTIASGLW